jgi:dihydrodipicolinate synthase/N-acetylneuraminate lyase
VVDDGAGSQDEARYPRTILGTCCVPWNEDGTLAEGVFRASVRALAGGGLRDLYLFGTAGEGYAVTDALFERIVRVFVEETAVLGVPPMVGVISLSLPTIVERIERAAALGVERFQISFPSWGTLSDGEVEAFFRHTCGRFPALRLLPPYQGASEAAFERYHTALATRFPAWLDPPPRPLP